MLPFYCCLFFVFSQNNSCCAFVLLYSPSYTHYLEAIALTVSGQQKMALLLVSGNLQYGIALVQLSSRIHSPIETNDALGNVLQGARN